MLRQPGRLHISTIDGLNHWLAGRLPLSSRLGDGVAIVDDARPLYAEAARRFVDRIEENSDVGEAVASLARLLDHNPARLAELLTDMLARRELWLPRILHASPDAALRIAMEGVLEAALADGLRALSARLPLELLRELADVLREAEAAADEPQGYGALSAHAGLPPADFSGLPGWQALRLGALTATGTVRKQVTKSQGFPPARKALKERCMALLAELALDPDAADALAAVDELPPARYSDAEWQLVEALCRALVPAAVELQALFAERGCMDHTAVAAAARESLGHEDSPTDLGLALDYRIQHLLIDEYQDTSQSQERLLRRLLAGWQGDPSRTLFCVGDPMQSIYAFREADVTLFLEAQTRGIAGVETQPAHLSANFRSCDSLIRWINEAFSRLLPAQDDFERGAVRYTPCTATRSDERGAGVEIHALIDRDARAEALHVVELVKKALQEIAELERDEAAGRHPREVALLVRSRAALPAILVALRERGISFRGVELEGLAERRAVADLLALTRALLHASDRTAWLAVLRAPWAGLALSDLAIVADGDRRAPIVDRLAQPDVVAGMTEHGRRCVARVLPVLQESVRDVGRAPLGSIVRAAWLALGGPATIEDDSDLANAESVFDALDRLAEEAGTRPEPSQLARAIDQLKASPIGSPDARVVVMTIHKAKGLEFDTVILPGLERRAGGPQRQLLYWTSLAVAPGMRELILASTTERDARGKAEPLERWMKGLDEQRQALELGRLAYVAATRARRRLHLVGSVATKLAKDQDEPVLKAPPGGTLLGFLWPVVEGAFDAALAARLAAGSLTEAAAAPRPQLSDGQQYRLPEEFAPREAESPAWAPRRQLAGGESAVRPDFDWAGQVAIAVGTVVHAELMLRAGKGSVRDAPGRAIQRWRTALAAEGVPVERLAEAVARVGSAIDTVDRSDFAKRLLDASQLESASELALTAVIDGELTSVKIDRTFVDHEGVRWIVDWKTSSHEGGQREQFLANELERYATQLARYAKVMQLYDGRPQRVGLYFPLLDAWAEWAAG